MRRERESFMDQRDPVMEQLTKQISRDLHSEKMRNMLGLGEKGSVSSRISAQYDPERKRIAFSFDSSKLSVVDLQELRKVIESRGKYYLRFNKSEESLGRWYLEWADPYKKNN